jgi:hypothetical protein
MARTTRTQVESTFKIFCKTLGVKYWDHNQTFAENCKAKAWSLDYNSIWGGYQIEIHNAINSGVSTFFKERLPADEIWNAMRFTMYANERAQKEVQ